MNDYDVTCFFWTLGAWVCLLVVGVILGIKALLRAVNDYLDSL